MEEAIPPSYVLSALCGGFVIGVIACSFIVSWWLPLACALGAFFGARYLFGINKSTWRLIVFGAFMLGAALSWGRYAAMTPDSQSVAGVLGDKEVEGQVVAIQITDSGQRLTLNNLRVQGSGVNDRVLLTVPRLPLYRIGDVVRTACSLKAPEPFDDFRYDHYLAAKDIYATCKTYQSPLIVEHRVTPRSLIADLHDASLRAIERTALPPHDALLAGLLFGDARFSEAWDERFLRTGTTHVVAASGYNVTLLVSLLGGLAVACGIRRRSAIPALIIGVICFVFFAGAGAAVTRAGMMASIALVATYVGRPSGAPRALFYAVCVMLAINPLLLRDDIGFQLSVTSTMGLLLFASPLGKRLIFIPETFGIRESVASTFAASFTTLPVLLAAGSGISVTSFLTNFFILPFVPYAMGFGALAAVVGIVSESLGRLVGLGAVGCTAWMLFVIRSFAQFGDALVAPPGVKELLILASLLAIMYAVHRTRSYE